MSNKRRTIWLIIAIAVILACLSIATYAYYVGEQKYAGSFNVDIESKGVDILTFNSSKDVEFNVDITNFSQEDGEDVSGESVIDVNLTTTKKETKYCYEVSFKMPDEEVFAYSTYGRPELVLDVYKKTADDKEYEKVIDSLDITTSKGTLAIPTEKEGKEYKNEIATTKNQEKVDSWKAVVTYKYFEDVYQGVNDSKDYNSSLKVKVVDC